MNPADLDDDATRETLAILQEEIARLEAELRDRDEALALATAAPNEPAGPAPEDAGLRRRVDELSSDLAAREEMIALLMEESRAYEETAEARRAEWEQLSRWVEEVERRVDGQAGRDDRLVDDLEAERRRADDLAARLDSERRAWDARRRWFDEEVAGLRARLEAAGPSSEGDEAAEYIAALQDENGRLREACVALEQEAAAAADVVPLRERLAAARAQAQQAKEEVTRLQDELARERIEHEAALNALKTELASTPPARPAAETPAPAAKPNRDSALDPDERIRAFRQHLQELHRHEAEQRAAKSLSGRLSRLWRHTAPG